MNKKEIVILFAAGGTGGHIFPALAFAEQIQERLPAAKIHFVGTAKGLEKKIIPYNNFPLHLISIGRLNRNVHLLERIKTLLFLPLAFVQSILLILKLKPQAVVGVGGYATGPILLMAALLKRRTYIWEPNAHPGMANRYLAPFVDCAFVVFPETAQYMKTKKVSVAGYPLRKMFAQKTKQPTPSDNLKLFIFGGSQGSRAINQVFLELYKDENFFAQKIEVVHQIGATDFSSVLKIYDQLPKIVKDKLQIFEFITDMPKYYNWADIAICRAGMGTVAELAAIAVPAIFIPLPNSADDHQLKNAQSMVERGAAELIEQKDFSVVTLKAHLQKYVDNPKSLVKMSDNMHSFYKAEASKKIVDKVLVDLGKQ